MLSPKCSVTLRVGYAATARLADIYTRTARSYSPEFRVVSGFLSVSSPRIQVSTKGEM